jgi:hypothetical protein
MRRASRPILARIRLGNGDEPDFSIEFQQFQALVAVDIFDLLVAAVDRKFVQICWLNAKHGLEGIGLYPTELWPIGVNFAVAVGLVEVNAPAIWANHAEVAAELVGGKVGIEVWPTGGVEVAAGSAAADAFPFTHGVKRGGNSALTYNPRWLWTVEQMCTYVNKMAAQVLFLGKIVWQDRRRTI